MPTTIASPAAGDAPEPRRHPAAAYHERRKAYRDRTIADVARDLLAKQGLGKLTVERVAADSGIAKTTIYRRAANAKDLAVFAIAGDDIERQAVTDLLEETRIQMLISARELYETALTAGTIDPGTPFEVFARLALDVATED